MPLAPSFGAAGHTFDALQGVTVHGEPLQFWQNTLQLLFFQAGGLFSIKNVIFWPILANFSYSYE